MWLIRSVSSNKFKQYMHFRNTYLLQRTSCAISMTTVLYQFESLGQCELAEHSIPKLLWNRLCVTSALFWAWLISTSTSLPPTDIEWMSMADLYDWTSLWTRNAKSTFFLKQIQNIANHWELCRAAVTLRDRGVVSHVHRTSCNASDITSTLLLTPSTASSGQTTLTDIDITWSLHHICTLWFKCLNVTFFKHVEWLCLSTSWHVHDNEQHYHTFLCIITYHTYSQKMSCLQIPRNLLNLYSANVILELLNCKKKYT